MTRTFLVAIDLDPSADIDSLAADLLDSLALDGFQVTSVKPWASAMTEPVDTGMGLPTLPSSFIQSP
jgi:hypothetical protein